jgi:GNAT superfamily N-acetyltransferase
MHIRQLVRSDVAAFSTLARDSGLASAPLFIERYLSWQPDGYFGGVLEAAGGTTQLVASVGAQRYGRVAFIGCMCVVQALQGRGLGRRILQHTLDACSSLGVETFLLEATDAGARLYSRMGFVAESTTTVLRRSEAACPPARDTPRRVRRSRGSDVDALVAFDAVRFGAPRRLVLTSWLAENAPRTFIAHDWRGRVAGYIVAGPATIGPWIADDMDSAEALLDAALRLPFSTDPAAYTATEAGASLFASRGFVTMRTMQRMRLGPPLPTATTRPLALLTAGVG